MARTVLPNGTILPAEHSDDWYEDMTSNLTKLDNVIGSNSEKLNSNDVSFLRMSSAALTDSGTGNFSDLNSSNKLKTGDFVLDSNRKFYQIVSVDSENETFTVGNSLFKVTAESDLSPVAESGDYDDLTDLPTYGITRYCSSVISDNSSVAFSAISSTDRIKVGDFLLDNSGKMYQISAVDSANETVSVTTPLTQLAVDSGVLHKALAEIITEEKTFLDIPIPFKSSSAELGVSGGATKIILTDKNLLNLAGIIFGNYSSSKLSYCRLCIYDKDSDNQEIENFVELAYVSNNQNAYLRPNVSNFISLGTTSNRWKDFYTNKINGLEPSAFGMPADRGSRIDILGSFTNMGTGQSNSYTAPANGYIYLNLSNVSKIISVSETSGGLANYANTIGGGSDGQFYVLFPIRKNDVYRCVWYTSSTVTVSYAYFLPCQGNV